MSSQDEGEVRVDVSEILKSVYPDAQLDSEASELLSAIGAQFVRDVIAGSSALAESRSASAVEVKDIAFHCRKQYNIDVPLGNAPEVPKDTSSSSHKKVKNGKKQPVGKVTGKKRARK